MESTGKRYEIQIKTMINIDISPIASFHWDDTRGKLLREARERAGYTREQVKEMTGLSTTYIQQLEVPSTFLNKPKKPKSMTVGAETLASVCKVLGCDLISLFWEIK